MNQTIFINLSHCITRDPIKGHPYWFHKTLLEAANRIGLNLLSCGPKDQKSGEIVGLLEHSGGLRSATSVFGLWRQTAEVTAMEELLRESSKMAVFHVYEGGFRELLFVRRLLRKNSDVVALFNFNLTDPWHFIFDGHTIIAQIARRAIKRVILEMGSQFVSMAETRETALRFDTNLDTVFVEYPLFSTIETSGSARGNKIRPVDVAFFPADINELSLVLVALTKFSESNKPISALVVPRWGLQLSTTEKKALDQLGVRYQEKTLDADGYEALYASIKIAVFPYEAPYYLNTSSGRVLDAAASGCYCIAPKGSLPGNQIRREGWGSDYLEMSSEIETGLQAWECFAPQNVPTAENSLSSLIALAQAAREKLTTRARTPLGTPDFLLFTLIFLGTGFRSWAPRLVQATRTFLRTYV